MTAAEIIRLLGGPSQVGVILGLDRTAVANMAARGSIPPRHWTKIVDAAATRRVWLADITLETLSAAAARPAKDSPDQGDSQA